MCATRTGTGSPTSSRSVATLFSALSLGGTVGGVRLLSPETVGLVCDEQSDGVDLVLGVPVRFGMGLALPEPRLLPYVPAGRICYWGGWGGSLVVCDLDRCMAIAYVMNRMAARILGSPRSQAYVRAAYDAG